MTITPEIEAKILRLFNVEGWLRGTIARQLNLHHSVVDRVIRNAGVAIKTSQKRRSKIEPYIPFILQTLEQYPKLNATRLHHMVKERGFTGGVDYFRHCVRKLRPRPAGEAYLRLTTLPGEQGQVDWGSFGKLKIGQAEHRLLAFVVVLSWSRRIFVKFYLGDDTANFLRGHVEAFAHFGCLPRELLYDNLKTAVIERVDNAIRFNTEMLKLAAYYNFAPKPVPVARPTSKGRVERAIQYVRTSFFAAREFSDLADLNRQALAWCEEEASSRRCLSERQLSVAEAFESEKQSMLPLPDSDYPVFERKSVVVGKTPYVRFCGNDYSVPHEFVRRTLLVQATLETVQIVDGIRVVAEHARSFSKNELIEDSGHVARLVAQKFGATRHQGMNRILNVVPASKEFFQYAAQRGHNMGRLTQLLLQMLDLYGSAELESVLNEALAAGRVHSQAIREMLEQRRMAKGLPPPVALTFLNGKHFDETAVTPKSLDSYDRLFSLGEDE